jgi:hypothetical protein
VNKDLSLTDFASNLKFYLLKTNDIILTKQYQLLVRDAKTLQKVFLEFQNLGISNVSITKLEHSDIEQYRKEVKVLAVKAAKEKAEALAIALNQKIGKAIYVEEVDELNQNLRSNKLQPFYGNNSTGMMKSRSFNSPIFDSVSEEIDIEFQKIKLESTFLVRFALE